MRDARETPSHQRGPSGVNLQLGRTLKSVRHQLRDYPMTKALSVSGFLPGVLPASVHTRRECVLLLRRAPRDRTRGLSVCESAPCFDALVASSCSAKPIFCTAVESRNNSGPEIVARSGDREQVQMRVDELAQPRTLPVLPDQDILRLRQPLNARIELRDEFAERSCFAAPSATPCP